MSSDQVPGQVGRALARLLAADRPWQLGRQVVSVREVTSTNDLARVLALGGAPEGTVVVADSQTAGRGRLGRPWHSPVGAGLWTSFILRPQVPLTGLAPLALVVALGAWRAAQECGAHEVRIKWPNDLVARGRKLAGILTESAGGSVLAAPDFVIAGIGVNVRTPPGGFREELSGIAVALDELTGGEDGSGSGWPGPSEYGRALVEHLSETYCEFAARGFGSLREEWLTANATTGKEVVVSGAGGSVTGFAEDVDADGRLVLRLANGGKELVAAGDVTLRR